MVAIKHFYNIFTRLSCTSILQIPIIFKVDRSVLLKKEKEKSEEKEENENKKNEENEEKNGLRFPYNWDIETILLFIPAKSL